MHSSALLDGSCVSPPTGGCLKVDMLTSDSPTYSTPGGSISLFNFLLDSTLREDH